MLNPKRTIPKLAIAALALTGCGGDNGNGGNGGTGGNGAAGTGGNGGAGDDGFAASLDAACTKFVDECEAPITKQYCIDYYNDLNNYNDDERCTTALISYFDCVADKTCRQLFVDDVCETEYYAADALCIDLP